MTLPSLAWMGVFFALPAVNLLLMAFRVPDTKGEAGAGWSLQAWSVWSQPGFAAAAWRTVWMSGVTMLLAVLLALPVAWRLRLATASWRPWLLLAVMMPFWTSFLVRVFAWRSLLQSSGPVASLLKATGMMEEGGMLLYHPATVLLVMVYMELPLAVLPLYAAMERLNLSEYEAARDLGAGPFRAFFYAVLPSVKKGIIAAALLVGVPSLGSYVVPEMVGGIDSELLGSKIGQRLFADRNLPQAAALACGLAFAAMPLVWLTLRRGKEELS